jgi:hypothetical protein
MKNRSGKTAAAAEVYLDSVYALLQPDVRVWANRSDIRPQWLPFALAHVRTERRGIATSTARDLADAIESVWVESRQFRRVP